MDFADRTTRLLFSFLGALFAVFCDALVAGVLYLMTQGALSMFFERRPIGADGLLGRYFREIGWTNATVSQFFALGITLVSVSLATLVLHWYATGAFRSTGAVRRIFWPAAAMLGAIIALDLLFFQYRLSALLFEVDNNLELPSWFALVVDHIGEWRAWLLIGATAYPAFALGAAILTQVTWSGLRDNFQDWLDLFRGAPAAAAAVPMVRAPVETADAPIVPRVPLPTVPASPAVTPLSQPAAPLPQSVNGPAQSRPSGAIADILREIEEARDGRHAAPVVRTDRVPPPAPISRPPAPEPAVRYRICETCNTLISGEHTCGSKNGGPATSAQVDAVAPS